MIRLPYETIFGGVSALTKSQMNQINGYSNLYFGWGGEDDDFRERYLIKLKKYQNKLFSILELLEMV